MIPDQLHTTKFSLRPFAISDAPDVYSYWKSDIGWEKFNKSVPSGFSESDAVRFLEEMCNRDRNLQPNWAIVQNNKAIGIVSFSFDKNQTCATIGYGIHADFKGQGLCAEAVREITERAFEHYPQLAEIRAHIDAENLASIRVVEKLGFVTATDHRCDGLVFCLQRSY